MPPSAICVYGAEDEPVDHVALQCPIHRPMEYTDLSAWPFRPNFTNLTLFRVGWPHQKIHMAVCLFHVEKDPYVEKYLLLYFWQGRFFVLF